MIINENSIIICNQNTKNKILEANFREKKLFNATFFSLEDFRNRLLFKITDEAMVYSADFLNVSYENAKVIAPYIYYIDSNANYTDSKLINLRSLKKELDIRGLLEKDDLFKTFISGKEIYVIDLFLDDFYEKMFNSLGSTNKVTVIKNAISNVKNNVVTFDNFNEEVDYVFSKIYHLLEEGKDINNIYIVSESDEYNHLLNRYSKLYNIATYIKERESIKNHNIFIEFINYLKSGFSKEVAFENIKDNNNVYVVNKIIELLNRFYFIKNNEKLVEVLESEVCNICYEEQIVNDAVKVVELSHSFKDSDYVFIIGYNNNSYPKSYIDENYLSDKYHGIVDVTLTDKKNKIERDKAVYLLSNIDNLYISFSRFTQTQNLISVLFEYLDFKEITVDVECGISPLRDSLKLGSMIDDLVNFNIRHELLDILYSSLKPNYKTYDNRYKQVDEELLQKKLNNYIKLSYSSISTFYKCQFSFYLDKILKIKHDGDKTAAEIGTMFHSILENYGTEGFDLETEKNKLLAQIEDKSTRFYFEKLWPGFSVVFEKIDSFNESTQLNEEMHEKEVNIDYSNELYEMIFTGKIDKIIYKTIDGIDYVGVVDYKTGSYDEASFNNIEYGFNLQLPVYAYFLVKSTLFKNPKVLGLYLQKILNDSKPTKTKDLHTAQLDDMKFQGYSIVDRSLLPILDPTYKKSSYIKSMSITSDDVFNHNAKVYSENDLLNIIETVERLIVEAFEKIQEGSFDINPKKIKDDNMSCKYCKYKNICYKTNNDIKVLEYQKFVENLSNEEGE